MADEALSIGDIVEFPYRNRRIQGEVIELHPKKGALIKYELSSASGRNISMSVNEGWRKLDVLTKVELKPGESRPGELLAAFAGAMAENEREKLNRPTIEVPPLG